MAVLASVVNCEMLFWPFMVVYMIVHETMEVLANLFNCKVLLWPFMAVWMIVK